VSALVEDTEFICRRCGGPNVDWAAPSPLWNEVMRGGDINDESEFREIMCPTCFCVLAQERGVADQFRVKASSVLKPLTYVTPSGRVWNEERGLWQEPTQ
jgi:hypothetical protein